MNNTIQLKSSAYNYTLFAVCFFYGIVGGLTSTLVPAYLPDIVKDFATENTERIGAIVNASFIYGMLVGGLVVGYCSDKWGRKFGLQVAVFCMGVFMLLAAFINAWWWLVFVRFMTGFGVGGILLVTAVIISEEWNDRNKSIALGILSISFPVGIFSAGIITYSVPGWRSAFLFGGVPVLLLFLNHFYLKETGAWLSDKMTPAKNKNGGAYKNALRDIIQGSLIYGTMLIGLWAVFAWLPTWVQSIVTNSDGQQERGISMMIFAAGGLLGGFISGWVSNKLGMKTVMLWCFGGAFVLSMVLFKFTTSLSAPAYFYMALIALFFGISQGVLNVYIPELFATPIRSTATGICFNISRIFTATVVFFVGWLVNVLNGYGNALFCFSFVFLIGFIIILLHKKK